MFSRMNSTSPTTIRKSPIGATEFNVLVLGETQSGKTTFVEAVRKYADQSATINEGAIGTGYGSHTTHVQTTSVTTDLPDYFVTKSMAKGIVAHQQTVVDYGEFICNQDEDDYEESLNRRRDLRMVRGPAKEHTLRFNFIDTPGLNSTTSEDELHVQGIFSELLEANSIHLVLITISSFGLFSQGLKDAIKCYLDMFPDFNGVIAFVHTRVDYKNLHPNCEKYAKALNRKMDALHEIMGRTTFPHFQIDCDLHTNKPIRDCITQSTIQKILQLAPFNKPVLMRQTAINKTQKMRDVDNLLKDKYNSTSMVIESTLRFKNQEEGDLLADIFQLETRIHKMDAEAVLLDEFLHRNNVMDLDLLYEERFDLDTDVGVSGSRHMRFPAQEFTIECVALLSNNVHITQQSGGERAKAWEVDFMQASRHNCVLHAKLYVLRSDRHQKEIQEKLARKTALEMERVQAVKERDNHSATHAQQKMLIQRIVDNHNKGIRILGRVSTELLMPEVFQALMGARAYVGSHSNCARVVERVYYGMIRDEVDILKEG